MFKKILVANRGEIACRIIRSLREMNITSVAIYSEADASAEHVLMADEAYCVGPAAAKESYLNVDKIISIMTEHKVEAVHPGYGFLSENMDFSAKCEAANIAFIGPENRHIIEFGLKHKAREIAASVGVPLVPGSGLLANLDEALDFAGKIGYPIMLKSTAGGGGIGMRICYNANELSECFDSIKRMGENYFSDSGVFLEKYIETSRHIEVQIFGNGTGKVVVLGERDCSVQRRNQKVVEETPAPNISDDTRQALHDAARNLCEKVDYRSAGTVEFIYDVKDEKFYFLEVNTRLQVEHGVTESVFHVDLVRWMIELAGGIDPTTDYVETTPDGCAIEFRIYAEDPNRDFRPSSGVITCANFPENIRCDKWIKTGTEVSAFYDPLLAKLIVCGPTRDVAIANSIEALKISRVDGFETNLGLLSKVLLNGEFKAGKVYTGLLKTMTFTLPTFEVIEPGVQTTVQDYPGRIGYWGVGVPPSGPMDSFNFRLANKLVGNTESAAGLEMTMRGGTFVFNVEAEVAFCGGDFAITINGEKIALYKAQKVSAGDKIICGKSENGHRLYMAIRGGISVPEYMGSCATFTLGRFGGHAGRALTAGDVLHIGEAVDTIRPYTQITTPLPITQAWEIAVMYGPHGAPEYFTQAGIDEFFAATWKVHFNSSRTGVRLVGPHPQWARENGGEAGLHPSNIHDNAYAIGAIDFTGDMPVILGVDGPSLGGFVCPVTIVAADLWKMGQLRPGDTINFIPISIAEATKREMQMQSFIANGGATLSPISVEITSPIVAEFNPENANDHIVCRQAGDRYILMEFGEPVLDIRMRFIAHAWFLKFEKEKIAGIVDLTPGIRSLQIHFDGTNLDQAQLLKLIAKFEQALRTERPTKVSSRKVYLPLSWNDPMVQLAIDKYTSTVRNDAPWCPSNIEFIRRINGLNSIEEVQNIIFNADYLVMGLGDVYLGAPVATPIDPRHRLVTTKYNPARTWTAENMVGIGGAYMCVYGMEGPGGYQLFGRTVPMWNRYNVTKEFETGKPWLLRPFDQIKFYLVEPDELLRLRQELISGRSSLKIEDTTFDIDEYCQFLEQNGDSIESFKNTQQGAFDAEYRYWLENGLLTFEAEESSHGRGDEVALEEGTIGVSAPVAGNMWKSMVTLDSIVTEETVMAILESMKTEIPVPAGVAGRIVQVFVKPGETVDSGQLLFSIAPEAR